MYKHTRVYRHTSLIYSYEIGAHQQQNKIRWTFEKHELVVHSECVF